MFNILWRITLSILIAAIVVVSVGAGYQDSFILERVNEQYYDRIVYVDIEHKIPDDWSEKIDVYKEIHLWNRVLTVKRNRYGAIMDNGWKWKLIKTMKFYGGNEPTIKYSNNHYSIVQNKHIYEKMKVGLEESRLVYKHIIQIFKTRDYRYNGFIIDDLNPNGRRILPKPSESPDTE